MTNRTDNEEPMVADHSPDYLFGRAVRVVCGCLAVVVSISQATVILTEDFISCPGHYVHWDHLGNFYQRVWPILLNSLTEWRIVPGYGDASPAGHTMVVTFLGSLGFALACLAKRTWFYPRLLVFAACTVGFLLVPILGLLETIKTFEAFGDMQEATTCVTRADDQEDVVMLYISCESLVRWIGFGLPLIMYPVIMLLTLWSCLRFRIAQKSRGGRAHD